MATKAQARDRRRYTTANTAPAATAYAKLPPPKPIMAIPPTGKMTGQTDANGRTERKVKKAQRPLADFRTISSNF